MKTDKEKMYVCTNCEGAEIVFAKLSDALELISEEVKATPENQYEDTEWKIEVKFYTSKELDEMGEYQG